MATRDGQTFGQQSAETQATFIAVYGASQAEAQWEQEHNAALGQVQGRPAIRNDENGTLNTGTSRATNRSPVAGTGKIDTEEQRNAIRGGRDPQSGHFEEVGGGDHGFFLNDAPGTIQASGSGGSSGGYGNGSSGGSNGSVPIGIDQGAANQAVQVAAEKAYREWLERTGDERLAFEKATQAIADALALGRLTLDTETQRGDMGLKALTLAGSLHADPFRQQQALHGIGANPYLSNAVGAIAGQSGFVAPTNAALTAGVNPTESISTLANRIGGTGTATQLTDAASALPASNKVVGREFLKFDPATQQYILSGLSSKEGLDQNVILQRIKDGLPQGFIAPSFASLKS